MPGELVQLHERAFVEEQLDALAGSLLALGMLLLHGFGRARVDGLVDTAVEIGQLAGRGMDVDVVGDLGALAGLCAQRTSPPAGLRVPGCGGGAGTGLAAVQSSASPTSPVGGYRPQRSNPAGNSGRELWPRRAAAGGSVANAVLAVGMRRSGETMCRLFGMTAGERRTTATFWLLQAPDSIDAQSRRNPDGTGLGTFDSAGRAVVEKQPIAAWEDVDFAREARERESSTFVAHVRQATTGAVSQRNTHPFTMDGRIFAHNGALGGLPALEHKLGADLAMVQGDTDSERLFALITAEVRRVGDVGEGLLAALAWVAAELPVMALNVVLSTPTDLYAVRYPATRELYLLDNRDGGEIDHRSAQGTRVRGRQGSVVVVASEPLDDSRWTLLEPGELVHVDASLEIARDIVLPDPLAHPRASAASR